MPIYIALSNTSVDEYSSVAKHFNGLLSNMNIRRLKINSVCNAN